MFLDTVTNFARMMLGQIVPKGSSRNASRLRVVDEGETARHLRRTKAGRLERVTIKRGHHMDRSRYTGAMLRALRAERGCGRPPKVLAARRANALARAEAGELADLRSAHTPQTGAA